MLLLLLNNCRARGREAGLACEVNKWDNGERECPSFKRWSFIYFAPADCSRVVVYLCTRLKNTFLKKLYYQIVPRPRCMVSPDKNTTIKQGLEPGAHAHTLVHCYNNIEDHRFLTDWYWGVSVFFFLKLYFIF